MKLPCECQGLNSRALQILRERLHFAPYIRQMRIAELRHDQSAALYVDFNPIQRAGEIVQCFIGCVQALQSAWVIPVVEAFRAKQKMKAPQRMDEAGSSGIRGRGT